MTVSVASFANPPRAAPRGLPAWVYSHPPLTRLEFERIFKPSWQIACHLSQLAGPGDFVTLDLYSDSVIVLRDAAGAVRAHRNVCRHRGTRLLEGAGKCAGRITCPYHGWSYRYDGSLLATPARDSFPDLNLAEYGLDPVATEIALGFVWVCLASPPPPPSPSQLWAPFLEELAPYQLERLVPIQPLQVECWDVDWKIAMDNYLESYHVPIGHPGLNRLFSPDYEDQRGAGPIARGISWMRQTPSARWSERIYQHYIGELTSNLPEPNRRSWRFYSCLPNLGIDVFPEQIDFFQVLPRAAGKALVRSAVFALPDGRREMRLMRWLGTRINREVNAEDRRLCERLQRGMGDSSYRPGPLSRIEQWMLQLHDLLRERIPEIELADAPARFA